MNDTIDKINIDYTNLFVIDAQVLEGIDGHQNISHITLENTMDLNNIDIIPYSFWVFECARVCVHAQSLMKMFNKVFMSIEYVQVRVSKRE